MDLNHFRIDCNRKREQIVMLQSMRQTGDEQLLASINNIARPWQAWSDPDAYWTRQEIGSGQINKHINANLKLLSLCP